MRRTIFTLLLTLATGLGTLLAATPNEEVVNAEKQWAAAVVNRDFPALDQILSDDLIYGHSTGAIESKSVYVGRLRSGVQRYDLIRHKKITVEVFGNAAVAHSIVLMKGTSDGRPFDDKLVMLQVWVKQAGRWRLVAHQTAKLKK